MRRIAYGLIALLSCVTVLVAARLPAATAATGPACSVGYTVSSQWATGFVVRAVITNDGPALSSWELQYAYAGNQKLGSGWDAAWSQSGEAVTASNASWNGALAAGASVTIGAQFSYSGSNAAPTAFTLNGTACNSGAGTPTPTPTTSPSTPPPTGPTVTLNSPTANGGVPSGSTLTLSATASAGSAGTVTSVAFYEVNYCGGYTTTEIGAATTAPYSVQWSNVAVGDYTLAAVVTTSTGTSVMSAAQQLVGTSGGLPPPCASPSDDPIVVIVSPQSSPTLNSDATVPVTALVGYSDNSGTGTSSVTFTAVGGCGTTSTVTIGTATAAPYTVSWQPPIGGWTLTATDADTPANVKSAPVQVFAGPGGIVPPCPTPAPTPTNSPSPTPSAG